ncbi:MAG: gliding motility-associated C-terminal domain-containing protein [Flavobacteriales bacterium]|nr:gliding motility-associated C-terminal domain-containing protein [Flavobacteriales bacterium]
MIYDRWGKKIFENTNFEVVSDKNVNRVQGWDGKYKGSILNSGVFVFYVRVIHVDNTMQEEKGDITLVR